MSTWLEIAEAQILKGIQNQIIPIMKLFQTPLNFQITVSNELVIEELVHKAMHVLSKYFFLILLYFLYFNLLSKSPWFSM